MTTNSLVAQRCCDEGRPQDDGVHFAASKLLQSSSYAALRGLRCEVMETVAVVHGVVPSYFLKQMAQSVIRRLDGIQSVMNLVEVRAAKGPQDNRLLCESHVGSEKIVD
jgi:hypothetical protein